MDTNFNLDGRDVFEQLKSEETRLGKLLGINKQNIASDPICLLKICITPARRFWEHYMYEDEMGRQYRVRIPLTIERTEQFGNINFFQSEPYVYFDYRITDGSNTRAIETLHPHVHDEINFKTRYRIKKDDTAKSIENVQGIVLEVYPRQQAYYEKGGTIQTRLTFNTGLCLIHFRNTYPRSFLFPPDDVIITRSTPFYL
jgi:hypothetical protein